MSRNMTTQTEIKLPRSINGKRSPDHPLLKVVREYTATVVAGKLGIDRTTVHYYVQNARKNRDCLISAELILALSKLSGIHPHYWRPDLYPKAGIPALQNKLPEGVDTPNG